jgi:hypothetical protein
VERRISGDSWLDLAVCRFELLGQRPLTIDVHHDRDSQGAAAFALDLWRSMTGRHGYDAPAFRARDFMHTAVSLGLRYRKDSSAGGAFSQMAPCLLFQQEFVTTRALEQQAFHGSSPTYA